MILTTEDNQAAKLISFLQKHGINPIYFFTAWAIIISLSYYKDLKNWDNVVRVKKWMIVVTLIGTVVFIFMSTLQLLGIANY